MSVANVVTIDDTVCTGCGICVESCPTDVLRLELSSSRAYVAYSEDCQACFLCVFDCPYDGAVTVRILMSDETRSAISRGQFAESGAVPA